MNDIPNSISVAPFDREDWIVRTAKYNRYKIVNFKPYNKRTKGQPRSGKAVFVYDKGNAMTLVAMNYIPTSDPSEKVKFGRSSASAFLLKIKDGRIIIWSVTLGGDASSIRNFSNRVNTVEKALFDFGMKNIYKDKFPKEEEEVLPEPAKPAASFEDMFNEEELGSSVKLSRFRRNWPECIKREKRQIKVATERLNKVLIHFLKRNGFKLKFGKNPFENLRTACYPFTSELELKEQWINPLVSRHFIHGDIKHVVKQCFGYDSAKLVRLVCEEIRKTKTLDCLLIGLLLKRLVPLDFFYKAVGNVASERLRIMYKDNNHLKLKDCRVLLKRYNAARILKLVTSQEFGTYYFPDTVRMFTQLADPNIELPEKPKDWREIHGRLVRCRTQIAQKVNSFELPVKKAYREVDGAVVDDLTLEVPKHTDKLQEYSDKMSNCIWGYGHQVKNGHCNLLGVYRGGILSYNISIVENQVSQFLGPRNTPPNEEDKTKVMKFLLEKRVINHDVHPIIPMDYAYGAAPARADQINPVVMDEAVLL